MPPCFGNCTLELLEKRNSLEQLRHLERFHKLASLTVHILPSCKYNVCSPHFGALVTRNPVGVLFSTPCNNFPCLQPRYVSALSSQAAMPPPAPRAPGAQGKHPRSRGGGIASQGSGGVGKRFWKTSGGSVATLAKGETHAMHRRMAAKRERDKAARAKRVSAAADVTLL